jgi:hypothetical protein
MVRSLIGSVAGARAHDGGYLVEFYSDLKAGKRVVGPYVEKLLRERGTANKRKFDRITSQQARGVAVPSDVQWVEGYRAFEARALAVYRAEQAGEAVE